MYALKSNYFFIKKDLNRHFTDILPVGFISSLTIRLPKLLNCCFHRVPNQSHWKSKEIFISLSLFSGESHPTYGVVFFRDLGVHV